MSGKGGKSSLKSPDGNGESAGTSKKGRRVQFDSEGSLENTFSQSLRKAGKGSSANGTNKDTTKAPTPIESKLERELPPNSVCLMDIEAAEILQGIQDQMVFLSQDPDIKLPVSFDVGLAFAKRGENHATALTVKKIFEPLKKHGVTDCEICLISNICPDSVDEVFALVPSLMPKKMKLKEPLRFALDELANLKESLANLKDTS